MEFRLSYVGRLLATGNDSLKHPNPNKLEHIHVIRKEFHKQLKHLWSTDATLIDRVYPNGAFKNPDFDMDFSKEGFVWRPIATSKNFLICALDILMLRPGGPGGALSDIDNRLKTLFDALRMAQTPQEITKSDHTKLSPDTSENPFFVLLEDDKLITHLSVTTDRLLEEVPGVPEKEAVRIVISVKIRPYFSKFENLDFV